MSGRISASCKPLHSNCFADEDKDDDNDDDSDDDDDDDFTQQPALWKMEMTARQQRR
jgi:hypothetical protein